MSLRGPLVLPVLLNAIPAVAVATRSPRDSEPSDATTNVSTAAQPDVIRPAAVDRPNANAPLLKPP